ncbi:MAG: recombinase family protein [Bacilli bacterium]|nr:recombinase family protein [Bacilli bacterium]
MVKIIKEELPIEESLKRKLELICEFSKTTPTIINCNRKIDKTNWTDVRILKILSNEIYKGDYVSGKTLNKLIYYENVVEPIVSKELWENCQTQKKKNQKNYMTTQTYIFLQKLRCPKCGRILGGGATHKIKADKWYFYYRCEDCKNNIKEETIENSVKKLLSDILEYDNVVNEFFLPVLKSKISSLKNTIDYWKDKFDKLISFLYSKLHNWYDKDDKYIDVVNDMYEDNVLDDDDIKDLKLSKEKDDSEMEL